MKLRWRLIWLVVLAPAVLLACKATETLPKRLGENKYVFIVLPKGALISAEEFQFATMRARALCERSNLKHFVSVEPDNVLENGQEVNVFHFTCDTPINPQSEAL